MMLGHRPSKMFLTEMCERVILQSSEALHDPVAPKEVNKVHIYVIQTDSPEIGYIQAT